MRLTPLAAEHRAAGAKLVEFAGWQMPLHYGSQIDEHQAVRRDAGMFDISHMLAVDVAGEGAFAFLRRVLANDVGRLVRPGKALYSCMLNEEGGIVDDLVAYFLARDRYRLIVNAATAEGDLAWLEALRAGDTGLVPRRDLAMLAVQGPQGREKCWSALPELRTASEPLGEFFGAQAGEIFVARTGYTGEDGFELSLPAARAADAWKKLLAAGARPCGLGARDTLRLEAGMKLYGQDMDQTVLPAECGLDWTVHDTPERDFVGRAALRQRAPRWALWGLVLDNGAGILRAHQKVETEHGDGLVTSGTFSPTLGTSIALARLPRAARAGDRVRAVIRDRRVAARVVTPPFVRRGRILVGGGAA